MQISRTPLWIFSLILFAFAQIDGHVIGDKVASNIEWTGAVILIALTFAVQKEA